MAIRTISLPLYLLDDDQIEELATKAAEVMAELADESDTSELPAVIDALKAELEMRGRVITLNDDGTFSLEGASRPGGAKLN